MHSKGGLFQLFVYLLATVLVVPLAKRLGLGSVLGYLLAGAAIGPYALRLVGTGPEAMHLGEFGVIMMLFLIGLELQPQLLWQMRRPILGLGGLQVAGTTLAVSAAGLAAGLRWQMACAIGMVLAMSSTAIVLQSLRERGEAKTPGGQACFSVLLLQDIAVIPILALMPLLATLGKPAQAEPAPGIAGLPGWQQALITLAAIAAIAIAGRYLLRHFFRFIAASRLREVFTATALLLVIAVVLLMDLVNLSPALGAFLAGVVLADSEYRHQLEADIEPFKGLLLGLFFISVGAAIDFALIRDRPLLIAALLASLVAVKFVVLLGLGRAFALEPGDNSLFAFALAQGGEFAFVLFSFAEQHSVLDPQVTKPLVAAVAMSMALTPLLLVAHERVVVPRFARLREQREPDLIDEHDNPVIVAGFGRFGHIVGRLLRANGFGVTVLDNDADWVDSLRKFGMKSYYGDAAREDLLRTAGAERARLLVLAIDDEEKSLAIVDLARQEFPQLKILARALSRQHAYELIRREVPWVYRDTFGSALDLSIDALVALGVRSVQAERAAKIFKEHDEAALRDMAQVPADSETYFFRARQHIENLERTLQADRAEFKSTLDGAWETRGEQRE